MVTLIVPFMLLSALGFGLSAYAHVMSVLGKSLFWGGSVWFLHIGIFVVWLPAVIAAQRVMRDAPQKDFWKIILAGCPAWMKTAQILVFVYAIANFLYFAPTHPARTHLENTDPSVIRGFSGHWLIFYGAAFSILYSVYRRPDLLEERKCPAGHPVAHLADYCGICGARVYVQNRNA